MRRAAFLTVYTMLAFLAVGPGTAQAGKTKRKLPNVIVIFADDLGYGDIGVYGARKIRTPNIDGLARRGVRFTDFYVPQAVCSASRAALLTGKYSNRARILGALGPSAKHGLVRHEFTLADLFRSLGYATAIYGKWHLGHLPEHLPMRHGFDEWFGLPYSNDMWPKHPTAKFPDLPLMEGEKILEHNPDQSRLTTWYTERSVKYIERNKDRPFFLYLPHSMPHVPLFVSERHKGKSAQGLYGDVIEELDWSVGQIVETLRKLGLEEDTLIIFTSDNGPWLSYGDHAGSAGLLREGKGTAWEGGVRVPFIACWPGRIPAGKTCNEPAMTIDLLPTLSRLVGGKLPAHKIDGKDISSLLQGKEGAISPHEALFFFWGNDLRAVRSGPWKLYFPHSYTTLAGGPGGKDGRPVPYKTAKCGLELYHLGRDLSETRDVAKENPEIVRRLQGLADRMREDPELSALKK